MFLRSVASYFHLTAAIKLSPTKLPFNARKPRLLVVSVGLEGRGRLCALYLGAELMSVFKVGQGTGGGVGGYHEHTACFFHSACRAACRR